MPKRPSALPIATTSSFLETDVSVLIVFIPDALLSLINATSSPASYPTTFAVYVLPVTPTSTWIFVAPLMTWLLVRTSPEDVRTMPEPAASPPPESVVAMFTIAGFTFFAIPSTSMLTFPDDREPEPNSPPS